MSKQQYGMAHAINAMLMKTKSDSKKNMTMTRKNPKFKPLYLSMCTKGAISQLTLKSVTSLDDRSPVKPPPVKHSSARASNEDSQSDENDIDKKIPSNSATSTNNYVLDLTCNPEFLKMDST